MLAAGAVMATIQLSYNEILNTARKAASGAGLPFGVAEEMGLAAVWLSRRGLDGVRVVIDAVNGPGRAQVLKGLSTIDLLQAHEDPPVRNIDAGLCALLIVGLAGAAETATGVRFCVRTDRIAMPLGEADAARLRLLQETPVITLERLAGIPADRAGYAPAPRPPATDLETFNAASLLAAKTYVPASESSRLTGAGAGTSDND